MTTPRLIRVGGAVLVSTCCLPLLSQAANAAPNADATEEEGVCEIFDDATASTQNYAFAFKMAVTAVQGDTGMDYQHSVQFVRQSVNDQCPVYRANLPN